MKYWEKFLQDETEKLRDGLEFLAETGSCGRILCMNCPFSDDIGDCKQLTMAEMQEILNKEVEE